MGEVEVTEGIKQTSRGGPSLILPSPAAAPRCAIGGLVWAARMVLFRLGCP